MQISKDRLDRVKETLGQYLQGDNPQALDGRPEAEVDGLARPSRTSSPGRDGDGDGLAF